MVENVSWFGGPESTSDLGHVLGVHIVPTLLEAERYPSAKSCSD